MGDYALVQLTRGYYGYVSYVCRNVVATRRCMLSKVFKKTECFLQDSIVLD